MANRDHIAIFQLGCSHWNDWRRDNPEVKPDLSDANFIDLSGEGTSIYDLPDYSDFDLSNANLCRVSTRNTSFCNCNFESAEFHFSDLCDSYFSLCNFRSAELQVSKIGSASFVQCDLEGANLSYCSAEETQFEGCSLKNAILQNMALVRTDFSASDLCGAYVYGSSVWDIKTKKTKQSDIVITKDQAIVTVDQIELAQFIYLMLNNKNVRNIIDTLTAKVVLILGRFSASEKAVLQAIKRELRQHDLVPVLFDFSKPASRDLTETISLLASMSKFVIADLTAPRSVPHELAAIVRNLPSVPILPLLKESEQEYAMFEHFTKYSWVLPIHSYSTTKSLISELRTNLIKQAYDKSAELRRKDRQHLNS